MWSLKATRWCQHSAPDYSAQWPGAKPSVVFVCFFSVCVCVGVLEDLMGLFSVPLRLRVHVVLSGKTEHTLTFSGL